MRRYFVAITAAFTTALGLVHPVAHASPAVTAAPPAAPTPAETDAVRQAQETGQPVEIADQTTETRQVLANPNGTFTLKSNRRAVRVKRDGAWRPIDTTLRRNPDGSLSPVATDQDVTFSGGGTAPVVTIRHGDKALTFSWPAALPEPAVSGDTAFYSNVLPGVDLQLRANADSYSQILIVRDAAAAANPALARIRLTATGTGLTFGVKADGSLSASDATGAEVLSGPPPVMWDSRRDDPLAPVPSATDPGLARATPIAVTGTPGEAGRGTGSPSTDITLVPDPAALIGPDVVYPVFIDPYMSSRKWHWIEVSQGGWTYYDRDDRNAEVGYCKDWENCGTPAWRARSYFQLDISPLWYRNGTAPAIWRAQFFAYQIWAADHNCNGGQPTAVHESGGFDSGTVWPGPAGQHLDTQYSNAGGPCAASNLVFNVWWGARHASDGHWASLVLGLLAGDENDKYQWKQFNNNPLLEVDFSFPPNNATNIRVSNEVKCGGTAITPDARPTLYSTATDNNIPPLQLGIGHEVWDRTGTVFKTSTASLGLINSGGVDGWRIPTLLGDGDYTFRTSVANIYPGDPNRNLWSAGWSPWYDFTIRATPPAAAPTLVSTMDYPSNYWGAPVGASGSIGVTASGAAHIVGYTYTFLGSGTEVVPNTNDCNYHRRFGDSGGFIPHHDLGTNWIPIPAGLRPGRQTVHIRSFDDAHNLSPEASYTFYVPQGTGLATQRFEAENLTRSQPAGQNIPFDPQGNCCNVAWSGGAHLYFGGTGPGQSFSLTFNTTLESDYQIAVGLTRANDYGQVAFRLDNQPIGQQTPTQPIGSFDGYNPVVIVAQQPLGIRHLTAGTHTLTVATTGTNPSSINLRYIAGIDYIDLTPTVRFEAEDSAQIGRGQDSRLVPQANTSGDRAWSNAGQLAFLNNTKDSVFDLTFQAPVEADYALGANLTKANDYGKLTFLLDDKPLLSTDTTPWDGYSSTVTTEYKPLGGAHLGAGAHKLTVKVADTNPASVNNRYQAGVDYLSVVPISNVTAASFTAAMNNHGISPDPTTSTVNLPVTLPRNTWTVTADSEQANETPARYAIDGDPNTIWHTQYAPTTPPLPHSITIDTHTSAILTGLRYLPRSDHVNGNIGNYQIHLSSDGTTWGNPVATGMFADSTAEKTVSFTPTTARYVRLTALTEAGNRGPLSSAAEINLTGLVPTISRSAWTVAADSQQANESPATYAIDGDPNTIWHTQYAPTTPPLPHTFTIDMHATNTVAGLRYLPRSDHVNGNIGNYQIHLSSDGTTWGNPVATGTFADTTLEKAVSFTPAPARYVRLTALTEAGNRGPWSSAAEINLTPGATDGLDLGGTFLSSQALAAAGYAPGNTATVGGAAFTMPAARADGMDNVIAIGQTIPFPAGQQIKASAVGLLVAATCGATPDTSGTVTYTDSTTQNTPFPKVEDWVSMPTDFASFVLPYRNDNTATNSTVRPRVLALFVPADPTRTLKSITLPNYGTSLVPGNCSPALHVLAIAPRPLVEGWVGVWAAPADTAKPAPSGGLADKTLRSVIHPTVTGASVRVRIANPTNAPVTIDAASLAAQTTAGAGTLAAPVALKFGGSNGITLPAAGEAVSDPVAYPTTSGGSGNLVVSLHVPTAVADAPIHASPNSATYLATGNATADTSGSPFTTVLGGFRYFSGVEVSTSDTSAGTVAVLGDQLTATAPPGSGHQPTWVDLLPGKLSTGGVPLPGGLVNASLAGMPPVAVWRLDDGSGTTARDSAGGTVTHPATLNGGATWSTERGGAVNLDGTGSLTSDSVLTTSTSSYTVSAWVKLGTTGTAAQTIASQDSTFGSSFALRYTGTASNKWAFAMFTSTGGTAAQALSTSTVQTGTWTHLVGVYNRASRTAELYVNGQFQGSASNPTPISASGSFVIGRGKTAGGTTAFLNGSVSDIRAFDRAATGWDAKILFNGGPGTGPQPGLGAFTATDANRTLDRTILNQPRLRTVIVALGANDILVGRSTALIKLELKELMDAIPSSATGISNRQRVDGSPVHVIVTTVPALGLPDNDQREQRRQALNADLLVHFADYGADEIVDLAAAVRDPAHPNQINPAYLTVGASNNAYHDAIAQAITDAATRFPPEAQL